MGIHDDRVPPPLAFCKRWDVIWSWLPVIFGLLLMAENLRQCLCKCRDCLRFAGANRRQILLPLLAFGSSIFPIYYNHYMIFLYVNDHWYSLLPVQLQFTITDNVALLLRFCDAFPEARAAIHSCHLLFLFTLESATWRLCSQKMSKQTLDPQT